VPVLHLKKAQAQKNRSDAVFLWVKNLW